MDVTERAEPTPCLDENDVVRFLEGGATSADEDHIDACEDCRALVTALGRTLELTLSAPDAPTPDGPFARGSDPGATDTELPDEVAAWELASGAELVARGARVGRYVILEAIGAGAMGVVYRAYDPELDRDVAIKLVRVLGEAARGDDARARLVREAQALARVAHPHVVAVHDASTYGEHVFVAMELVEGTDLEAWLAAAPRSWRAVLAPFVAAGRGLAAAHAAGVIHRDVKAANILVGDDGRARITDFGLAVASDEAPATAAGTPAYMSPEVAAGAPADAASDQFSFARALERATPDAPRAIRRILARALAPSPAGRFSSLTALLDALERAAAPRRWPLVAAGLALLAASVVAVVVARAPAAAPACADPAARLAGVWDAPAKAQIRAAFVASGHPLALDQWARVETALDGFARAWSRTYTDACEATHVRHEQSPDLLDRRMACLADETARLRALTGQLASADRALVARAIGASDIGDRLARCSDVAALRASAPLPATPALRARSAAATSALAYAEAISLRAKFAPAIAMARAVTIEARAIGDARLEADSLRSAGESQWRSGDYAGALATLHDAVDAAKRAGGPDLEAGALLDLVAVLVEQGTYGEALQVARLAESTIRAYGDDARLGKLLGNRAAVHYLQGDFAAARADYERALALFEKELGPEHRIVGQTVMNLAMLAAEGDTIDPLPLYARALAIHERALGPRHPEVALTLANRAIALANVKRFADAYADLERALAIRTEVLGPAHRDTLGTLQTTALVAEEEKDFTRALAVQRDVLARLGPDVPADHPTRGHTLAAIGRALVELGRLGDARAPLEQALAILDAAKIAGPASASARFALARALWETGGDRARAQKLVQRALADLGPGAAPERRAELDAWLAAHGGAR